MLANSLPPAVASAASAAIVSVLGPTAVSGPGPGASQAMGSNSLHPAATPPAKIDIVPKALSSVPDPGSGCPIILSEGNDSNLKEVLLDFSACQPPASEERQLDDSEGMMIERGNARPGSEPVFVPPSAEPTGPPGFNFAVEPSPSAPMPTSLSSESFSPAESIVDKSPNSKRSPDPPKADNPDTNISSSASPSSSPNPSSSSHPVDNPLDTDPNSNAAEAAASNNPKITVILIIVTSAVALAVFFFGFWYIACHRIPGKGPLTIGTTSRRRSRRKGVGKRGKLGAISEIREIGMGEMLGEEVVDSWDSSSLDGSSIV